MTWFKDIGIKPYFEDDSVMIYNADCREVLPMLAPGSVDLVLTDPPYGVGIEYGTFEDTREGLSTLISDVWPALLSLKSTILATTGVKNLWVYTQPDWILCWFMPNGIGVWPWGFCTWQPILAYGKDPYAGKGSRPDGIERVVAVSDRNGHPVPKPLNVMRWLVQRGTTLPGQVILDPFMGSGTTLRASKDLGRKAIGIEIEERYCEIAVKRLSQQSMDLNI